ncbi:MULTISPECIES: hypothetical protein [unclassified Uliginosibacterium]|uniref:hypothetical protein n=1 Tax=unclassified Uliginosibacterium TaxID=2621521 RepID=UPI00117D60EF|nr:MULTISPECIES: hypothetical protein [unclassified Uliginosibacterium]MDO6387042.1 hypothetical protein [Uliginosibacterium sp. 31-12]
MFSILNKLHQLQLMDRERTQANVPQNFLIDTSVLLIGACAVPKTGVLRPGVTQIGSSVSAAGACRASPSRHSTGKNNRSVTFNALSSGERERPFHWHVGCSVIRAPHRNALPSRS